MAFPFNLNVFNTVPSLFLLLFPYCFPFFVPLNLFFPLLHLVLIFSITLTLIENRCNNAGEDCVFWLAFANNYSSIGLIILHVIPFIELVLKFLQCLDFGWHTLKRVCRGPFQQKRIELNIKHYSADSKVPPKSAQLTLKALPVGSHCEH